MIGIAFLLAGAAVGYGLARWLNLPSIPMLLLAGLSLSATGLLSQAMLQDALVLGVTFLVFVAGVELNPRRVGAQRRAALRVGAGQFLLLGLAGFVTARLLGFELQPSLYLALALTASSTLVVVRLLQRRRQLFEPFGRLVIGVLLLQDLLVIILMPVLIRAPYGVAAVAGGLIATLALVTFAYVCLRWITPHFLQRLHHDEETLLLAVLALLFVFVGFANGLGLPLVAGAFLAGVALSAFPISGMVRGQLDSLSDFFSALFFTALGGFLVIPTAAELMHALVFGLIVVLITPPLVTLIAERTGLSARPAIESGLLLSQTSEFSLVVGLQGVVLGHLGANVFTTIALVTVITMVLTPFIATDQVTWWLMRFHPLRRRPQLAQRPDGHVLLLGCGANGMPLLETLLSANLEVVAVDDDAAIIEWLREGEIPCIRGDASDPLVLARAGADRARVIISTVRRPKDNIPVLHYAPGVPTLVRVFDVADAEAIRARGGTPILYSHAAAEDFLEWFDRNFPRRAGEPALAHGAADDGGAAALAE